MKFLITNSTSYLNKKYSWVLDIGENLVWSLQCPYWNWNPCQCNIFKYIVFLDSQRHQLSEFCFSLLWHIFCIRALKSVVFSSRSYALFACMRGERGSPFHSKSSSLACSTGQLGGMFLPFLSTVSDYQLSICNFYKRSSLLYPIYEYNYSCYTICIIGHDCQSKLRSKHAKYHHHEPAKHSRWKLQA